MNKDDNLFLGLKKLFDSLENTFSSFLPTHFENNQQFILLITNIAKQISTKRSL